VLYSGTDERVQVSVDGTPRRFVHDESGRVIGEYGATGTVFAEHVWLMPDTDEGGWEPLALLGASTLSYVHGDHLGVPVICPLLSGPATIIVWTMKERLDGRTRAPRIERSACTRSPILQCEPSGPRMASLRGRQRMARLRLLHGVDCGQRQRE
jgi:hypothetical protein